MDGGMIQCPLSLYIYIYYISDEMGWIVLSSGFFLLSFFCFVLFWIYRYIYVYINPVYMKMTILQSLSLITRCFHSIELVRFQCVLSRLRVCVLR